MAIKDAEHPPQVETKKQGQKQNPISVKNMSELGKLVSTMATSHIPHNYPDNITHPLVMNVQEHEHQAPDLEVRNPVLEPIHAATAPVNLVAAAIPQPVNNSLNQGKPEMTLQAPTPRASIDSSITTIDQVQMNTQASTPAQALTTAAKVMETAPVDQTTATPAAAASAVPATPAAPNLGKAVRKVGLGIEGLLYKPVEGEAALIDKFNSLVNGTVEVRDEVNTISERLAALEAKRSIVVSTEDDYSAEAIAKRVALGVGVGVVTYGAIILVAKGIEALTSNGTSAE